MELLLKRNEIGCHKYDLFAKLELTSEEQTRLRKADTKNTYVWEPDLLLTVRLFWELIRRFGSLVSSELTS